MKDQTLHLLSNPCRLAVEHRPDRSDASMLCNALREWVIWTYANELPRRLHGLNINRLNGFLGNEVDVSHNSVIIK